MNKIFPLLLAVTLFLSACSSFPEEESIAEPSTEPSARESSQSIDYQGLTKDAWEGLQQQKEKFEMMSDEEKQAALEGGTVGCTKFVHLWEEESIAIELIRHVGVDKFEAWVQAQHDNGLCADIYNFADYFGLNLETLIKLIEEYKLIEIYDVETIKARYPYMSKVSSVDVNANNTEASPISFPAYQDGKNDNNTAVYETKPFQISLELPDGWTTRKWEQNDGFAFTSLFTPLSIINQDGMAIGVIGFNTYEEVEGAEELPQAIYSQIALGNNYHFDVRDSYSIIAEADAGTTALVEIYYSAVINNGIEKNNKGIVSYNKDFLVYIAVEFEAEQITDEQMASIAASIKFVN